MSYVLPKDFGPVVIVGGAGRMGMFFGNLLRSVSVPCETIELDTPALRRQELLGKAAVVIVSVPISKTVGVIEQLLPHLHPQSLLVDLTSVKEIPLRSMMAHSGEVLGMHPMFAPSDRGLQSQTVITCPGRPGVRADALCQFLTAQGARLRELTAARHDQLMAIVQGLNHFHSIAFAHALGELGIPVEETIDVASPVYLLRIQLMGRILAQDPLLYTDIQLYNPHVVDALKAFLTSAERFMDAISEGSHEACVRFFSEAAQSFGGYRDTALRESDDILAHLQPPLMTLAPKK